MVRIKHREHARAKLHPSHKQQEQNLPVQFWLTKVARYPAIDAQVDHRRKRPDILGISEPAKRSCDCCNQQIHRQRPIFMMQQRGNRKNRASGHPGDRPHQDTEDDRRLKRQVRGQEVRHRRPDPDPDRQRHADNRDQPRRLSRSSPGSQQQIFERFDRASELDTAAATPSSISSVIRISLESTGCTPLLYAESRKRQQIHSSHPMRRCAI